MKITMRPMTAEEAWEHILDNHSMYHKDLKKYGYTYEMFIPNVSIIKEMFEKETLTPADIEKYKDVFINKIYNVEKLKHLEPIFDGEIKSRFEKAVNDYLTPLLPSWNASMPKSLELQCGYGYGSGYLRPDDDHAIMLFRVSRYPENPEYIFNIMFHEFVHMLIETPIIRKYHVPQNLKERIVDLICYEFIKKPVQSMFINSFANKYITTEAIKTDLPGAVQKMMIDYTILQPKQNSMVQK